MKDNTFYGEKLILFGLFSFPSFWFVDFHFGLFVKFFRERIVERREEKGFDETLYQIIIIYGGYG